MISLPLFSYSLSLPLFFYSLVKLLHAAFNVLGQWFALQTHCRPHATKLTNPRHVIVYVDCVSHLSISMSAKY